MSINLAGVGELGIDVEVISLIAAPGESVGSNTSDVTIDVLKMLEIEPP